MALSTEWVALKTGQSGSGGVEYSVLDGFGPCFAQHLFIQVHFK